jgi:STELLO glycosyltransferases
VILAVTTCLIGYFASKGLPEATPSNRAISTLSFSSDSTGKLFQGKVIRSFAGSRFFFPSSPTYNHASKAFPRHSKVSPLGCRQWAVVTTIHAPSESVRSVASLALEAADDYWCMVVVGDVKTPDNYMDLLWRDMLSSSSTQQRRVAQNAADDSNIVHSRVIYLSARDQDLLYGRHDFVRQMPYRSFARKNIGFLFAIAHDAQVIYDFDDDNILLTDENQERDSTLYMTPLNPSWTKRDSIPSIRHPRNSTSDQLSFNPLPFMRPTLPDDPNSVRIWPRGFPLRDVSTIEPAAKLRLASLPLSRVGVIQAVCDGDPDVDAIYRLTRVLPVSFSRDSDPLAVPSGRYSPYNAQATTHLYSSFWGLLLPHTVPGRVTDIWRSYFVQRLFVDLGLRLVYTAPLVQHQRTAHDCLADFQAESDLYLKTDSLLRFLVHDFNPSKERKMRLDDDMYACYFLESLWIELYERDYLGLADVLAMQQWLSALLAVGYVFPSALGK